LCFKQNDSFVLLTGMNTLVNVALINLSN